MCLKFYVFIGSEQNAKVCEFVKEIKKKSSIS